MSNKRRCVIFALLAGLALLFYYLQANTEEIGRASLKWISGASRLSWFVSDPRLDCARILRGDAEYTKYAAQHRISLAHNHPVNMSCEAIRQRHNFSVNPADEDDYPLAQARAVFKDYLFIELDFAATYSAQNWYCYVLDAKSGPLFKRRMRALAACFPNVQVLDSELEMDSAGKNVTNAYMHCIQSLAVPEKRWNYVSVLNNHDITLRTRAQQVQIFRWMEGANDVLVYTDLGRVNRSLDWSFGALNLFKNVSRNYSPSSNGFAPVFPMLASGYVQVSLTRAAVDFMLRELDLRALQRRISQIPYAGDEMFFGTLHSADALQMPGGFTQLCAKRGIKVYHMTRVTFWRWLTTVTCHSGNYRHEVCTFGIEDVAPNLAQLPHLFANKVWPSFDFGTAQCWHEELRNRTHQWSKRRQLAALNAQHYTQLANVRFQRFKAQMAAMANRTGGGTGPTRKEIQTHFQCTLDEQKQQPWELERG